MNEPGESNAIIFNYAGFATECSDEAEALHCGPGSVMDREEINYYFRNYTRAPQDLSSPEIYLLKAEIHDLPPAFLVVPDRDIVASDSFEMVKKLQASGNVAEAKVYRGAMHSFLEAMSMSRLAREAIADGARFIARTLATSGI